MFEIRQITLVVLLVFGVIQLQPFLNATTQAPKQACETQADIVFLLDSSSSVGEVNFQKMLGFVLNIATSFNIGPAAVQVGVVTFQSSVNSEFNMNTYTTKEALLSAINATKYTSGGTNTGNAITFMRENSFSAAAGERPGVPDIGIILTDGQSANPNLTFKESQKTREAGVTLFAIGVGSGADKTELNAIATDPDNDHVYTAIDFDALKSLEPLMSAITCEDSDTLVQAQLFVILNYTIPASDDLTVKSTLDKYTAELERALLHFFRVTMENNLKAVNVTDIERDSISLQSNSILTISDSEKSKSDLAESVSILSDGGTVEIFGLETTASVVVVRIDSDSDGGTHVSDGLTTAELVGTIIGVVGGVVAIIALVLQCMGVCSICGKKKKDVYNSPNYPDPATYYPDPATVIHELDSAPGRTYARPVVALNRNNDSSVEWRKVEVRNLADPHQNMYRIENHYHYHAPVGQPFPKLPIQMSRNEHRAIERNQQRAIGRNQQRAIGRNQHRAFEYNEDQYGHNNYM